MAFLSFRKVGCKRDEKVVLDDVSFDLESGETLVLLGRSGSGKTTIIRLILRLLTFDRGEILFENKDLRLADVIQLRRRVGYVIQEIGLLPHWTVAQNVAMVPGLERWKQADIDARVHELLNEVNLPAGQYASRYPHQLSGGQRQRVGVARALAVRPALLLYDEPFGALDPITRHDMQQQFVALREQYRIPSIFVTHDVTEALKLGTRIAVLDQGRIETIAKPHEFLNARTSTARAFLETLDGAAGAA